MGGWGKAGRRGGGGSPSGEEVVEEKMSGGVIGLIRRIGRGRHRPGRWGFGHVCDE